MEVLDKSDEKSFAVNKSAKSPVIIVLVSLIKVEKSPNIMLFIGNIFMDKIIKIVAMNDINRNTHMEVINNLLILFKLITLAIVEDILKKINGVTKVKIKLLNILPNGNKIFADSPKNKPEIIPQIIANNITNVNL